MVACRVPATPTRSARCGCVVTRVCTLYFADGEHRWLSLEVDVTIVEGPDAPARLLRYFRVRDGKPSGPLDYHSDRSHYVGLGDDAFLKVMADENAVLYSFTITKTYGNR